MVKKMMMDVLSKFKSKKEFLEKFHKLNKMSKLFFKPLLGLIAFNTIYMNSASCFLVATFSHFYSASVYHYWRNLNEYFLVFRALCMILLFLLSLKIFWRRGYKILFYETFFIYVSAVGLSLFVFYLLHGMVNHEFYYYVYFCFFSFFGLLLNEEFWYSYYKLVFGLAICYLIVCFDGNLYGGYDTFFSVSMIGLIVVLFLLDKAILGFIFVSVVCFICYRWQCLSRGICGIGYFFQIPIFVIIYLIWKKVRWWLFFSILAFFIMMICANINYNPHFFKSMTKKLNCRIQLISGKNMPSEYKPEISLFKTKSYFNTYGNNAKPSPHNVFIESFYNFGIVVGLWYIAVNILCLKGLWLLKRRCFWLCLFLHYTIESVIEGNLLCQRAFIFIHVLGIVTYLKYKYDKKFSLENNVTC